MYEPMRAEEASPADEVPNDVMQLITVASFTGLCQVIVALADNGVLAPDQLQEIENHMGAPLDDPDWRDDSSMAKARDLLDQVLATSMVQSLVQWSPKPDSPESRVTN